MTMTLAQPQIKSLIARELKDLIEIRRDLHAHPELNYQEHRTSDVVQRQLSRLNIPFKANIAQTGVVAYLAATTDHGNTLPSVALRADMDALPITEQTGKPYASCNPGVMHACGHDGHTTILLGAARILAALPHRPRPVTFIFQPAEEGAPDGEEGGAPRMIAEGALENPKIEAVYGLHQRPEEPTGTLGWRSGPLMAGSDTWHLTLRGTMRHGAAPHLGHDTILMAAEAIQALQAISSRRSNPDTAR